jgi:hypothetical protein
MTRENENSNEPELLRVHLRGGQTLELVVSDWGLKKNSFSGELSELRWHSSNGDRMPFVRLEAVDAVTAHPVPNGPHEDYREE